MMSNQSANQFLDIEVDTGIINVECSRVECWITINELVATKERLKNAEEGVQHMQSSLTCLRHGLAKELKQKELFRRQAEELKHQLVAIKNFVMNQQSPADEIRERVLSCIQMDTILESHGSLDGLVLDRSPLTPIRAPTLSPIRHNQFNLKPMF